MTEEKKPPRKAREDVEYGVVLPFLPKVEYVFTHTCDSQKFFLHKDGAVQCCGCSQYVPHKVWGEYGPGAPKDSA